MTDDDKALVESLRDMPVWPMEEAADRIEALSAKLAEAEALLELQNQDIGRLRYELRCIFNDYQDCMADEWIADVRAALGETK